MKVYSMNLYDYFNVKAPENAGGILTCYVPDVNAEVNAERNNPAMLVIPGGGYGFISMREAEPVALKYISYGFTSFVLDYSISPVRYPYCLVEAIMAMNYIRLNAEELHIDPEMVAAVGFSAGGHLCGMLGSYYDSPEAAEIFKPKTSARPNAVILSYPVITCGPKAHQGSFDNLCGNDVALMEKLSVPNLVNKNSSPAFIWATRDDGGVPVYNSLAAALAYEREGLPFSVHIYGKGWHGTSVADLTVYNDKMYKDLTASDFTPSIPTWVELSVEWMKEQGIAIKD
ncbi:MAG: alpha/beta hydrolase [Clostridia bacterium]|nr:alpha/beta hydrolase [Clostridia bacterium]